MTDAVLEKQLQDAVGKGKRDAVGIWGAYRAFWTAGRKKAVDDGHAWIFKDEAVSVEAAGLVGGGGPATVAVRATIPALFNSLSDRDVARVFWAVTGGVAAATAQWRALRPVKPMEVRVAASGAIASAIVDREGREEARAWILQVWGEMSEEEREKVLRVFLRSGALTEKLLTDLGPEAHELARRRLDPWDLARILPGRVGQAAFSPAINANVTGRLTTLLASLELPLDLRDGGLANSELARLRAPFRSPRDEQLRGQLLEQALRRMRGYSPETDMIADMLLAYQRVPERTEPRGLVALGVPLLRLLHARMILEAPSLSAALERPEQHLVPEALLYLLGRDGVAYEPELRILQGGDRRWRARWVESTAEALSTIVLESALDLDLTTLSRVPETREETPDFRATTKGGERVAFESKGATHWRTHVAQRAKALSQLGKGPTSKRDAPAWWHGEGRVFGCCFFAAKLGEERSSSMYLGDPPVDFDALFPSGWEEKARRKHYAAVAETAGLWRLADRLQKPPPVKEGPPHGEEDDPEGEVFRFRTGDDRGGSVVGTSTSLESLARRLRHPQAAIFEGARMFVGMPQSLYRRLEKGELPSGPVVPAPNAESPQMTENSIGVIAGREGKARGVFSLLSDGSFLAFEVEKA